MPHVLQREGIRIVAFNKSAHTSIVNTFCTPIGKEVKRGSQTFYGGDGVRRLTGDRDDWPQALVTYVFVRNPVGRAVSAWNHLMKNMRGDAPYHAMATLGFRKEWDFEQFASKLLSIPPAKLDEHLRPQSMQLEEVGLHQNPRPIFVKVEKLNQVWPQICWTNFLGCAQQLPRMNEHPTDYAVPAAVEKNLLRYYADDSLLWRNAVGE